VDIVVVTAAIAAGISGELSVNSVKPTEVVVPGLFPWW